MEQPGGEDGAFPVQKVKEYATDKESCHNQREQPKGKPAGENGHMVKGKGGGTEYLSRAFAPVAAQSQITQTPEKQLLQKDYT